MDYKTIILNIFMIMAILLGNVYGITNYNRDIILSPNKINHHPGKIVFYQPEFGGTSTNGDNYSTISANSETTTKSKILSTPWEDALKYSTYLAFKDRDKHDNQNNYKHTSHSNINHNLLDFHVLNKAQYIPQNSYSNLQKFGDIVMLARGKLQKNEHNQFSFIEANLENCELNKLCPSEFTNSKENNLLALWMIEKIRHRNSNNHGHRFEMRITIMPNNNEHSISFILRDIDYPHMFVNHDVNRQDMLRKSKINRSFFDFGDLFKNSPAPINYRPQLNTGEYYAQGHHHQYPIPPPTRIPDNYVHLQRPTLPYVPQTNLVFPTSTHFDQYKQQHQLHDFRFPESTTPILTNKLSEQPQMTTHLHHHFYVNNKKINELNPQQQIHHQHHNQQQHHNQFIGDARGIIEPDHAPRLTTNFEHPPHITQKPEFNTFETPQVFNDQIPIPPRFQIQHQPIHHHNQIVQIPQQHHNQHQLHEQQQQQPPHHSQQHIFEVPYVIHQPQYYQPQTIPVTTVQYMQQLQIPPYPPIVNIPSSTYHPNHRHPQPVHTTFHESPQYIEQQQFSEPDPIYHPDIYRQNYPQEYYRTSLPTPLPHTDSIKSINHLAENPKNNFEVINTKETDDEQQKHHQDDRGTQDNYPDSINAQLPPPEPHADENVPYVETSVVTQKSVSPSIIIVPSVSVNQNHHQISSSSSNHVKSESPEIKTLKSKVNARQSLRQQIARTSTEKPVLKWMPKRTKLNRILSTTSINVTSTPEPSEVNIEKVQSITTKLYSSKYASSSTTTPETIITITPSTSVTSTTSTASSQEPAGMESQTRKSFSTSISVEIGDRKHKLFHDSRPKIKLAEIGNEKNSDANKIEMIKADIQSMNTNSPVMHLFRASDEVNNNKRQDDVNLDPIALSIIQHAKSIARH